MLLSPLGLPRWPLGRLQQVLESVVQHRQNQRRAAQSRAAREIGVRYSRKHVKALMFDLEEKVAV